MGKKFNDTGLCVPGRHFMVDVSRKIEQIIELIGEGEYFTINRPRQFGKTTIFYFLEKKLNQTEDCLAFKISFEGIGDIPFDGEQNFCPTLLRLISRSAMRTNPDMADYVMQASQRVHTFEELSIFISEFITRTRKKAVLLIDEVDKSSDNQIFLNFLGVLRNKYLQRNEGEDYTFQSVVLAGVHDIKTLKLKIRPDSEKKYNSPWNIAVDFTIDMSFNPAEIGTMVQEYCSDKRIQADIPAIADKLWYYTSGYPYLVSKLCKFIDEQIIPKRNEKKWTVDDVNEGFKMIVDPSYTTTLFDSMTKNLENNQDLYDAVLNIVINGNTMTFTIADHVIALGHLYGILSKADDGRCQIHNRIFEQRIYDYMMSKLGRTTYDINGFAGPEYYCDDELDVRLILQKFQTFMKEHYSDRDVRFLEREGRLLFLSFLRPILNGKGFEFKEPNVADERRMDIVITYKNKRYVAELKRWYGPKAHQEGLRQLSSYLDMLSLKEGYLLIYDFSKNKEYKQEDIVFQDKRIFAVWV